MPLQPMPYYRPIVSGRFGQVDDSWARWFRDIGRKVGSILWAEDMGRGYLIRPNFSRGSSTTLNITPGMYVVSGSDNLTVWWNEEITFECGSGGSNSTSDDLVPDDIFYVYIDYSTITQHELTAENFYCATFEPTWDSSKGGWYNSYDRCIFAFHTYASTPGVSDFTHSGEYVANPYSAHIASAFSPSDTWTTLTSKSPSFVRRNYISIWTSPNGDTAVKNTVYIRKKGNTSEGSIVATLDTVDQRSNTLVVLDDSLQFELKFFVANTSHQVSVRNLGWYLPAGI